MALEQHYYTSSAGIDQQSGFATRAKTPDLTASQLSELKSNISYKIPAQMLSQPLTDRPVSMRFLPKSVYEAYLIHIVSSGKDEVGREGNFFAHSVVGTIDDMTTVYAPIFLWGSPWWVRKDPDPQNVLNLAPIATLPPYDEFAYTSIYDFIAKNRQTFALLLSAVIQYPINKKRIVIADTDEHVMKWIAAVSMSLPSQHACRISFSTYQSSFKNSVYQITGISSDSSFSRADKNSYFVITREEGCISQIEKSDFASFVAHNFSERFQEEILVDFHKDLQNYLNNATNEELALHIDSFFNLWSKHSGKSVSHVFSPNSIISATNEVAIHVAKSQRLSRQNKEKYLHEILNIYIVENNEEASQTFIDELVQTIQLLRPYDSDPAETVKDIYKLVLSLAERNENHYALDIIKAVRSSYDRRILEAVINEVGMLEKAKSILKSSDVERHKFFWETLGGYLSFHPLGEPQYNDLISYSLQCIDDNNDYTHPPDHRLHPLIGLIFQTNIDVDFILRVACEYSTRKNSLLFLWMYYSVVGHQTGEQRRPFRNKWWTCLPHASVPAYELAYDLLNQQDKAAQLAMLSEWHRTTPQDKFPDILIQGTDIFGLLKEPLDTLLITDILLFPGLTTLEAARIEGWCQKLFDIVADEDLTAEPRLEQVYDRAVAGELPVKFSQKQKGNLVLGRTLKKSSLSADDVKTLGSYFSKIEDQETYRHQINRFIKAFFCTANKETRQTHINLVYMVYKPRYADIFWDVYWSHFLKVFLEPRTIEHGIDIMETWFDGYYHKLQPYVNETYLVYLPQYLYELDENKRFKRTRAHFLDALQKKKWGHIVTPHISEPSQSKGLFGLNIFGRDR